MITWNPSWGRVGDLGTHRGFVYDPQHIAYNNRLELGHVISFMYETDWKSETTDPEDRPSPRLVFVMHPDYKGKCHALTLKYIDRDMLLRDVYPYIRAGLTDPETFYKQYYKPTALYSTDSYRTYFVNKMSNITQFKYSVPVEGSDAKVMEEFLRSEERTEA